MIELRLSRPQDGKPTFGIHVTEGPPPHLRATFGETVIVDADLTPAIWIRLGLQA